MQHILLYFIIFFHGQKSFNILNNLIIDEFRQKIWDCKLCKL